jgi:hypothetical protein
MACGNLVKELDPVFDDICLVCLKEWIIHMKVSRLIPTADAIAQKEALEPTVRTPNSKANARANATTVIIKKPLQK